MFESANKITRRESRTRTALPPTYPHKICTEPECEIKHGQNAKIKTTQKLLQHAITANCISPEICFKQKKTTCSCATHSDLSIEPVEIHASLLTHSDRLCVFQSFKTHNTAITAAMIIKHKK